MIRAALEKLRRRHNRDRMRVEQVILTVVMTDGRRVTWRAVYPADVLITSGRVSAQASEYWEYVTDRTVIPGSVTVELLRSTGTQITMTTTGFAPGEEATW